MNEYAMRSVLMILSIKAGYFVIEQLIDMKQTSVPAKIWFFIVTSYPIPLPHDIRHGKLKYQGSF